MRKEHSKSPTGAMEAARNRSAIKNSVSAFLAHVGLSEHMPALQDLGVQTLSDLIDTFPRATMGLTPCPTWACHLTFSNSRRPGPGRSMAARCYAGRESGKCVAMHSQLSSVLDSSHSCDVDDRVERQLPCTPSR